MGQTAGGTGEGTAPARRAPAATPATTRMPTRSENVVGRCARPTNAATSATIQSPAVPKSTPRLVRQSRT